jgi:hypothetical protein
MVIFLNKTRARPFIKIEVEKVQPKIINTNPIKTPDSSHGHHHAQKKYNKKENTIMTTKY